MASFYFSDLEKMMIAESIVVLLTVDDFHKMDDFPTSYQIMMMRRDTMRNALIKLSKKPGLPETKKMIQGSLANFPRITQEMFLADYQRLSMES